MREARQIAAAGDAAIDEDAFFLAPRAVQPAWDDECGEDEASVMPGDQSPVKKKRKQLPAWTSQPETSTPSSLSPTEKSTTPPTRALRERSVSVTPPPELDAEMLEFARRAVENVMRRDADTASRKKADDSDHAIPSSDDAPLDLNADLAKYYRGPNALHLRERAIARQRELQAQRQRRNEEAEVTEILHADASSPVVIHVDDSSDEEPSVPSTVMLAAEATPEEPADSAGTMALLLRAAKGEPLPVKVRPTTKMATILSHFLQTYTSLLTADEAANAFLSFEGDVCILR